MFVTDIRKEFYDVVVNQASSECFCSCVVAGSLFNRCYYFRLINVYKSL